MRTIEIQSTGSGHDPEVLSHLNGFPLIVSSETPEFAYTAYGRVPKDQLGHVTQVGLSFVESDFEVSPEMSGWMDKKDLGTLRAALWELLARHEITKVIAGDPRWPKHEETDE